MNKNIFFIILVALVIGTGVYMSNSNSDKLDGEQDEKITRVKPLDEKREVVDMEEEAYDGDDAMMKKDENSNEVMMEKEDDSNEVMMDEKDEGTMIKAVGEYVDYDPQLLDRAEEGDVVLFFKAGWCPSCVTLNKALENSLDEFPEDLTILKVDYDNSSDLKKKYAVTYQHTLVQVDVNGDEINKWNGGNNLNDVLNKLK